MTPDRQLGIDTWSLLLRTHVVVIEKLKKQMRDQHNLPIAWFDVLTQLRLAGGRLRMTELAEAVLLSSSGLTRLLDKMDEKGLVERSPCEDDRRGHWAALTKEGRRLARATWPTHSRGIDQYFLDHLSQDEVKALHSALAKVLGGHT